MPNSVKINFAFNLTYSASGLLFHLITFPYVSRVLFADGVGIIQFYQSIINYVVLCSSLGIPLYAIREIARVRDNKVECSKIAIEIFILHVFLTIFGYFLIFGLASFIDKIHTHYFLFLLLSTHLFLNAIGAYWFFQGIEDFKYITIRAVSVRTISLIALFIFVNDKADLLIYAFIIVTAEAGNNLYNIWRLRKFVDVKLVSMSGLRPFKHLRPALKIFVLNLVISIYINLDTVMLGFLKNETTVGYYAASSKITKSILAIAQSLGGVLLPRFSNLVESNQMDELNKLAEKALSFILGISLPITIGVIWLASPLIHIFCGNNFEPSILTIQIMAPIILFISVSNIAGPQILYALGKENLVIISTSVGAVTNVLLNLLLIPDYSQYGAGIATSAAELIVLFFLIAFCKQYVSLNFLSRQNIAYYIGSAFIFFWFLLLKVFDFNEYMYCSLSVVTSVILYLGFLTFMKDRLVIEVIEIIKRRKKSSHCNRQCS